ncbi:endonuclease/exonuclease/phosphatase family protein [Halieaceae bacterium IMCC14734]|uniref:Endonuclease/exonuclease/phosphatase family protein n=1 Tax=Candidatus Litorirhabdus singularis TaxID=2518993 RepID=A0ABT3TAP2_9GAMM|nr:endonuclease/exonuclease/phosphatase family protein [Candidatus Litorirhabdus singularis]MCX2979347.1 endonuclease/exonuclease/phosphatase family protein [Candidatus Litorirhabdus singularis]
MYRTFKIFGLLSLAIMASSTGLFRSASAEALAPLAVCDLRDQQPAAAMAQPSMDGSQIRLANWNIQKASQQGWRHDLRLLGEDIDLLLLQEAVLERELETTIDNADLHAVFAPGYATDDERTGVMTLSRTPPISECLLSHQEPWLLTPKATGISTYRISGSTQPLLVINLHAVNFTFGTSALDQQLSDATGVIRQHQGPVIFSGDFNTWSAARLLLLTSLMEQLGLAALDYNDDQRKLVFGLPLDHIFVRGLRVVSSGTRAVTSSDHNPIFATFAVDS